MSELIIIGLENCKPCKVFIARHPEMPYITLPRRCKTDKQALALKRKLTNLGSIGFPALLDTHTDRVIPLSDFDPQFAKEYDY